MFDIYIQANATMESVVQNLSFFHLQGLICITIIIKQLIRFKSRRCFFSFPKYQFHQL